MSASTSVCLSSPSIQMGVARAKPKECITQEVLVRFHDETVVVELPRTNKTESFQASWLLSYWSDLKGWPLHLLRIRSWQTPFVTIETNCKLLGGKGGFGTLLKGQSRQAGAKLTTDFGACRDLQGRRLRHVNDELKLRKWRDMERRRQEGEEVKDDELWQTPSGIYNWHLMTPTWADISRKATYRIKRQFQKMDKEQQKEILKKKEQEEMYQKSMTYYLEQTESAVDDIQSNLQDALKQGLAATKKRKRAPGGPSPASLAGQPNSLCTLSGDVVVVSKGPSVQMQSKSDFATAVLVLDRFADNIYFEVTIVSGGLAQIGWASLVGDGSLSFNPNNDLGDGVGDDSASYAIDGSRGLKFHGGDEEPYTLEWKEGDRVGCLWDCKAKAISFSLNGKNAGVAFSGVALEYLVPAFSCNQGEVLELHTTAHDCRFFPKQAVAVNDLIDEPPPTELSPRPVADNLKPKCKSSADSETKLKPATPPKKPKKVEDIPTKKAAIEPELLDLRPYQSAKDLEKLGFDRLKSALMALQVKCGGTLEQRADRLFSLKGLERKDYPLKVRAKGFIE